MTNQRQRLGRWGETVAAEYLQKKGYQIIERNVRTPYGEIDLVAKDGSLLVLVEVKTRSSRKFGLPEESINLRKQTHMLASAEYYAAESGEETWQVDVVSIEGRPGQKFEVLHLENVLSQ